MAYQVIVVDDASPGPCVDAGMIWNGTDTLTTTNALAGTSLTLSSTLTGGALSDIAINTDKFLVEATTGDVTVGGNLTVDNNSIFTGDVTCSLELDVTGDFKINTDKFTVASASGNTDIAGTLNVTGQSSFVDILSSGLGLGATSNAATSGAVTVSLDTLYDGYTTNATANIDASLADGKAGQLKIIKLENKVTNNLILTPTNFSDATTITFDATGKIAVLVFESSGWQLVYTNATVA